jgi:hypothetical protein
MITWWSVTGSALSAQAMRSQRIPNPRTALTTLSLALPFADSPRIFKAPLGLGIDPRNRTEIIRAGGTE